MRKLLSFLLQTLTITSFTVVIVACDAKFLSPVNGDENKIQPKPKFELVNINSKDFNVFGEDIEQWKFIFDLYSKEALKLKKDLQELESETTNVEILNSFGLMLQIQTVWYESIYEEATYYINYDVNQSSQNKTQIQTVLKKIDQLLEKISNWLKIHESDLKASDKKQWEKLTQHINGKKVEFNKLLEK